MTREEIVIQRRLNAARTALANKYGNLYGIKLRRWFVFNGEAAWIREGDLRRFEERLDGLRMSMGQSSHRARREARNALA